MALRTGSLPLVTLPAPRVPALALAFSAFFLWGCAAPKAPQPAPQPAPAPVEVRVSLIGTSDLHGHVEPQRFTVQDAAGAQVPVQRGGMPLFGGYLDNLRRRQPVVLLDAGDLFQGTLTSNLGEGAAVIDAYNALGYSAAAIGNHEFDYGPVGPRAVPRAGTEDDPRGALKARIQAARFPFLSANVLDEASGQPVTWPNTAPSTLIRVSGKVSGKVSGEVSGEAPGAPQIVLGVIGATAEDTPRTTNAMNLRGLRIAKVVPAAREQAARLRAQGAHAVVLVVHEGANCKRFEDPRDLSSCNNDDEHVLSMARALKGDVDAIIGGHSHAGVAHFVEGVPVVQSFMGGKSFGRIDLTFVSPPPGAQGQPSLARDRTRIFPPTEICSVQTEQRLRCDREALAGAALRPTHYEGAEVKEDTKVAQAIAPHAARAVAAREERLGVSAPTALRRNYRAESLLGTLLADLIREGAAEATGERIDIAFQNGGGIRADLPQGDLTYGHLYEVLPFDNRLAVLRLPGAALADLMRRNLQSGAGVLLPSGMTVEARCEGQALQVTLRDQAGKVIDAGPPQKGQKGTTGKARLYTVATSDFLAAGGDNFGAVLASLPPETVTYYDDLPPLREIVRRALRHHPVLGPNQEPAQAQAQGKGKVAATRLQLPMPRPIRCDPAQRE